MSDRHGHDSLSPEDRSRLMGRIRGRNTQPELAVRKALFALGLRYRLHNRRLPGCPDLVFPGWRAVMLIHGCYWHCHGCHLFRLPSTNTEFWQNKFKMNLARDRRNIDDLSAAGWRVMIVWECAIRGRTSLGIKPVAAKCVRWLNSQDALSSISGTT